MKVLHISTHDNGGAANAAIRIHNSLLKNGVESSILFLGKSKSNIKNSFYFEKKYVDDNLTVPALTLKNYFKERFFNYYTKQKQAYLNKKKSEAEFQNMLKNDSLINFEVYSSPHSKFDITQHPIYIESTIIHFHYVSDFVDFNTFFSKNTKPVIWSLHDENPYLGAFHFEEDVTNNKAKYGLINSEFTELKRNYIRNSSNISFILASDWIFNKIKELQLTNEENLYRINYPIDTKLYKVYDKVFIQNYFGLNENRDTIKLLFIAGNIKNKRKGFDLVEPILKSRLMEKIELIILGNVEVKYQHKNIHYFGTISDELLMPLFYNLADYLLIPSRNENFSYSKIESLCCGTPVIAFPVGDQKEFIEKNDFGIIATEITSESLIVAIEKSINMNTYFDNELISKRAQEYFEADRIVNELKKVYNNCLN
jgi:glycosyltransferase involved in cell wall biosynthesis